MTDAVAEKELRIVLYIGPWGFLSGKHAIAVHFRDDMPDLRNLARGEGNALSFVLEDTDLSTNFAKALEDGRFLKCTQAGRWELRYVPPAYHVR